MKTKRIDSLISLINTMTKTEKKHFSSQEVRFNEDKAYVCLYDLLCKYPNNEEKVRKEFCKRHAEGSFTITVHYLYEKILESLLRLRKERDIFYRLSQEVSKARMLYDKSMYNECFEILGEVSSEAQKYEYNELLLVITKLELEYLLGLNFPDMKEEDLYHKHHLQKKALNTIRKVVEQSSLYNLLEYRLSYKGMIRTPEQKKSLNDLMVNELYLVASSDLENNFEITKNHRLFQASYLMNIGDYSVALNFYKELNELFEDNPRYWANPPIYYLSVLEGILRSLRSIGRYEDFPFFIDKLKKLGDNTTIEFRNDICALELMYAIIPLIDKGYFEEAEDICRKYDNRYKLSMLSPARGSEIGLYLAIVALGNEDYKAARKILDKTIYDKSSDYLPLTKTIRLLRLLVYYQLKEEQLIRYESRSIRRGLSLKKEESYRTEHTMLWFVNKTDLPLFKNDREKEWKRMESLVQFLRSNRYEKRLLQIFDFTSWIESVVLKKKLKEVLLEKNNN